MIEICALNLKESVFPFWYCISSDNVSIQSVVDETLGQLTTNFNNKKSKITEENLQARIRGLYLMAFSNNDNYLVLTTGNK